MESLDLSPETIIQLFSLQPSSAVINEIIEWHRALSPSYGLVKSIVSKVLTADDGRFLIKSAEFVVDVLKELHLKKCPRLYYRAYLSVLGSNIESIGRESREKAVHRWQEVPADVFEDYLQAFRVEIGQQAQHCIPKQAIQQQIGVLLSKRDYDGAMTIIKAAKYPKDLLIVMFEKMANNKDASKAANYIKSHKLDPGLFPKVGERLNKNMVRHFLRSGGWELAEEIVWEQPELLACLVEDLLFKEKSKEAMSIWHRHQEIEQHIGKEDARNEINKWKLIAQEELQTAIIPNTYLVDYFGPSEQQYISLADLNIKQQQVVWVDTHTPQTAERFVEAVKRAQMLAVDTESVVGRTKLDRKKQEPISIMQIAFKDQIFIIDGSNVSPLIAKAIVEFIEQGKVVLGHALQNDLQVLLISIGLSQKQAQNVHFRRVVDTCKLFKAINPQQRHSNLAHICRRVLGREICKKQTLTNWGRRPLRRNQLHYAAMDAYCVLEVYWKIREEVGENMLAYYTGEDF